MINKKGFTLIELLAVIIILGILMIIAVPSVTSYINNSRKNAYVDTANRIVRGASTLVNSGDFEMYDTDTTYYIPGECIKLESGGSNSPYGKWKNEYVLVTYDGEEYDYYWASTDEAGMGINPTYSNDLTTESVVSGITEIRPNVGVGSRSKIVVFEDCECASTATAPSSFIDDKSSSSGAGNNENNVQVNNTTTNDNVTWTNDGLSVEVALENCDSGTTEKSCNAHIAALNSDNNSTILNYVATFTVPEGTRIIGGPYTKEIADATISGTTLTIVGNKNLKPDRVISAGDSLESNKTSLRIAYPKDSEFVLTNGNIKYTIVGDETKVFTLSNMKVTIKRTGLDYIDGSYKIKNTLIVENTSGSTLSLWSFRLSVPGLTSSNIISPLNKISEGNGYVVIGPVSNNNSADNISSGSSITQQDKIELYVNNVNGEITLE